MRKWQGSPIQSSKTATDTLLNGFEGYTPTLFYSPTGGFMNGTNGYGDQAKAQMFWADSSYKVLGALYWFGYKRQTQSAGASQVLFRMYRRDSIQQVLGVMAPVPGSWFEQKLVPLEDIPVGDVFPDSLFLWMLDTVRYVQGPYFFGFELEGMHPMDTIALYSSDSGQVLVNNRSWEKWQGLWNTIQNNWGLPVDFAIFPIVDLSNMGVVTEAGVVRFQMAHNPGSQVPLVIADAPFPLMLQARLMNAEGRTLYAKQFFLEQGRNYLQWNELPVSSGTYIWLFIVGRSQEGIAFKFVMH
ncbi:MAG: hypothetical protein N2110_06260 [Flavobacteriales bacterium]|nr:hypothetical protein [Flavobacteriales bacterium]